MNLWLGVAGWLVAALTAAFAMLSLWHAHQRERRLERGIRDWRAVAHNALALRAEDAVSEHSKTRVMRPHW